MKSWAYLLAAVALYGGAYTSRPSTPRTPADTARALLRPLALPFLWQGVVDAQRRGSLGEHVARGRQLMGLLPTWVDGHVYFASQLVFDGREPGVDPDGAGDRLFAALAWLEEVRGLSPEREDEILATMASLVEIRAAQDPDLARVIERREQRAPAEIADDFLARAEQLAPTASLRERRVFLAPKLMASALRTGAETRFALLLDETILQAGNLRDRDLADRFTSELELLRSYWRGEGDVTLDDLREQLLLAELVPFLPERKP